MSADTMSESIEGEPPTLQELADEVEAAQAQANDAKQMAREAQQKFLEVREREMAKDQRIDDLEDELAEARNEIEHLRDRTGLLETVQKGSAMAIDERAAVLIQTLYNQAWERKTSDAATNPKAAIDYKAAQAALGGTIARSKIYRTFDKAEALVDDTSVVEKVGEARGSSKNTRLRLSLEDGDVPATVAGQEITQPEGVRT